MTCEISRNRIVSSLLFAGSCRSSAQVPVQQVDQVDTAFELASSFSMAKRMFPSAAFLRPGQHWRV
jgi:hypothetical protein